MRQALSVYGVGASEISTVAGFNPYETEWGLYLRKTGQAPDIDPTPPIEWGHRLEPSIRQKYADDTGATMYVPSESMFHPEHRWARATPDAIVLKDTEPLAEWSHLMQVKNVGYWPGKDWEGGPPVYVQLQELWEMHVTGLARADVAALIAGSDYRVYTVHRDDKMIADLVDIAAAFWRRVEARTPPVVDESEACRRHFTSRLVKAPIVELVADEALERTIAAWRDAKLSLKRAEKTVETLRNTVLSTLTEAQADRIVSSIGMPKLARHAEREQRETDWRLVAQLVASAPQPMTPDAYAAIVEANTVTVTIPATVSLREPREWSKDNK